MEQPIPMDRLYLLNPGQTLDVGDRTLTAFRPHSSTIPALSACSTSAAGPASAPTASAHPCPMPSLPGATTSARSPRTSSVPRNCSSQASTARGYIRSIARSTSPRWSRCAPWTQPSFSAPTCRRRSAAYRSSSMRPRHHRPTRSSGPISRRWRQCSPSSNPPPPQDDHNARGLKAMGEQLPQVSAARRRRHLGWARSVPPRPCPTH